MIPAWRLIGKSGGRFPVPLGQDPLILFILIVFLLMLLGTEAWWVTVLIFGLSVVIGKVQYDRLKRKEEWQKNEWARMAAAQALYHNKKIKCITLDTLYEEYHGKPRKKPKS